MDVTSARTFLAIVDTGNFNRTAEIVNVTQSTVSARIKALEGSLDQKLFVVKPLSYVPLSKRVSGTGGRMFKD
jgi:DNA-binding transcriptional LysR family regulator